MSREPQKRICGQAREWRRLRSSSLHHRDPCPLSAGLRSSFRSPRAGLFQTFIEAAMLLLPSSRDQPALPPRS